MRKTAPTGMNIVISAKAGIPFIPSSRLSPGRRALLLFCLMAAAAVVPAAAEPSVDAPIRLGMGDAIALALRNNIAIRLASAHTLEAKGRVLQAAAEILPHWLGLAQRTRVYKENLAALGFTNGPFKILIGPFNIFDLRTELAFKLIDLGAWRRAQAAGAGDAMASLEEGLAREQVAAAAALAYVETRRTENAIESAQADDRLAIDLLALARERRKVGTATGIDVARAETHEAEERLRLLDARTAAAEEDLRLKHLVGLPLGPALELADPLRFDDFPLPSTAPAVAQAMSDRLELKIAGKRVDLEAYAAKAAGEERLPAVNATADVGLSGPDPDASARTTGSVGVALAIPFFTGGAVRGREKEAEGRKSEAESDLADLRVQVEQDVRLALQRLDTAKDRVQTAEEAFALAASELNMARDRFSAGVGDNVELVDAQTTLERARDTQVAAMALYDAERINLAMALGHMKEFKF